MSAARDGRTREQGGLLIISLVFVAMFVVIFTSISGLVSRSYQQTVLQAQDEQSFQIAEAGLNYGRWRLAHNQADFSSETRNVTDQLAGTLGTYELTYTAPVNGSTIILVTSRGHTVQHPERVVILQARYGMRSLAQYAYVTNQDIWFGTSETVGRLHANGGIRMDGTSDSLITSSKATYLCRAIFGCTPNRTKPGVWGSGSNSALWQFPVVAIDYVGIAQDLVTMKTAAQTPGKGFEYGPSGFFGYHIIFNADNTFSIFVVKTKKTAVQSQGTDGATETSSYDINTETLLETKTVPANGIIYVEDNLWVEGHIRGHVSVGAGVFPDTPATNVNIILNGNITYDGVLDGSRAFGAVAQKDVLIPYNAAPTNLTVQGAFVAQKGAFQRRYYSGSVKGKFSLFGMIASNGIATETWVDGGGTVISGYPQTESVYDTNLLYGAPPYFPTTGQYEFISWQQLP